MADQNILRNDLRALQLKRRFLVFRNFTNVDPNKRTAPLAFTWKEIAQASQQWRQARDARALQQQQKQHHSGEINSKAIVSVGAHANPLFENFSKTIIAERKIADPIARMRERLAEEDHESHVAEVKKCRRPNRQPTTTAAGRRRRRQSSRLKANRSACNDELTTKTDPPTGTAQSAATSANVNRFRRRYVPKLRAFRSFDGGGEAAVKKRNFVDTYDLPDGCAHLNRHISIPSRYATVRVQLQEHLGFNSAVPRFDCSDEITTQDAAGDSSSAVRVASCPTCGAEKTTLRCKTCSKSGDGGDGATRNRQTKDETARFTGFGGTEPRFAGRNAYNLSVLPATTPPASKYYITHAVLDSVKPHTLSVSIANNNNNSAVRRIRPRADRMPPPNAYRLEKFGSHGQTWHSDLGHFDRQAANRFPNWHLISDNPYGYGCDKSHRADALCYEPDDSAVRRLREGRGIIPLNSGSDARLPPISAELTDTPAPNVYFNTDDVSLRTPRKEYVRSAHMALPNLERFVMEHNVLMNADSERPAGVGPQNNGHVTPNLSLIDLRSHKSFSFDKAAYNKPPVDTPLTNRSLTQYMRRHAQRMRELGKAFGGRAAAANNEYVTASTDSNRNLSKNMLKNTENNNASERLFPSMAAKGGRGPSPTRYQRNALRGPKKRSFHFNWDRIWMNR